MTSEPGRLPVSTALREAGNGEQSITELMSRAPTYTDEDLDRAIEILRLQRARFQSAAEAKSRKTRTQLSTTSTKTADELDL